MHLQVLPAVLITLIPFLSARSALLVGSASSNITPDEPVAISGQFHLRVASKTESPVTANVLALESTKDGKSVEQVIMVSCDVVSIPASVLELVRQEVSQRMQGLDTRKIFLAATHTHTAPVLKLDKYKLPETGVMTIERYRTFFAGQVADAIVRAWESRAPGSVSWGLGHAVVAYNRRAVYLNGSAKMYGATGTPTFQGLEGYEDHDVNTLFAWKKDGALAGLAVNVSCPSQEVEGRRTINADFWHPVRVMLREQYGDSVNVLGLTGAAGDQSPHLMYRKAADERMRQLRGLTRLQEIARRVVHAVDETHEAVKENRHQDIPLMHRVETIRMPMRIVTDAEYKEAKTFVDQALAKIEKDPKAADREYRKMKWYEETVLRFEKQLTNPKPMYETEIHVIRVGDVVICTNPFELFTEFGIRIKARSKAVQTFVVQLVGSGSYVPTKKAVRGGHYSAIVHSNLVGPEGGQVLVERTVDLINQLWKK